MKWIRYVLYQPKPFYVICKFAKIDHAELLKISYQTLSHFFTVAENETAHGIF